MTIYIILIGIGLVVISTIATLIAESRRKTSAERFGLRFGLDVPEDLEPTIRYGVQARRVGSPIGTLIAVTTAVVLLLLHPGLSLLAAWWCLFGAYLVGASLGATIALLVAEQKRDRGILRVARTKAVVVADYVPSIQSVLVRVFVALAVIVFAADCWLAASVSPNFLSIVSGLLAWLSVVTLIIYEFESRRLIRRGAPAGTPLELAWDDGLRAYALTNLNGTVGLIPLYSLIAYDTLSLNSTGIYSNPLFPVFTGLFPVVATVGILMLIVFMTRVRTRQHFLRRLWPDLAAKVDDNVDGSYASIMGGR